ncbi:3759_t:CDS:2 [Gigaspora margarita]|uniref:3759_t:CDS:1 n=1 Tax=Gigaspora margarita TaxID=4874 RepID=A0ABN7UX50_GIGMA|nr:3759_t:CDS:2 [Gigaspora margarita]
MEVRKKDIGKIVEEYKKDIMEKDNHNEQNELMDDNFLNNIYKELKKILEVLKKIVEEHKKDDQENNLLIKTFKNIESKIFKIMVENDKFFDKQVEDLKKNKQGFDLKFTSISKLNTEGTTSTNFGFYELDNMYYPCKGIIESVSCKANELIMAKNLEGKVLEEKRALATLFYVCLLKYV